jgi:signal peptidase I
MVALLAGLFEVAVLAIAGLIYGFGASTYAHGPVAVVGNVTYLACWLAGLETARAFLLQRWACGRPARVVATTLLLVLPSLTLSQWGTLTGADRAAFEIAGGELLPATVESLLATLLAVAGGPWAAIAYRAVPLAAEWLSPVLPQLGWTVGTLFGVLAAGGALVAVLPLLQPAPTAVEQKPGGVPGWLVATAAIFAAVIWLNTGLLGVRPALVSGVSMEPNLYLGDLIFTRPVAAASLQPGDVIRFRNGGVSIVHRIVAVRRGPEGLVFETKGDNNGFMDAPVAAADVEGRMVLRVPKLGLLPITLKNLLYESMS